MSHNKNKMSAFFDFDDFLVGLNPIMIDWAKAEYGKTITLEQISHFDWWLEQFGNEFSRFWKTPSLYGKIKPLPGAVWFIKESINLLGRENVVIATVTHPAVVEIKEALSLEFFGIKPHQMNSHAEKHLITNGPLTDDFPLNISRHIQHQNKPGILFNMNGRYGWGNPETYAAKCPSINATKQSHKFLYAQTHEQVFNHLVAIKESFSLAAA
jgi:hypothetical protein